MNRRTFMQTAMATSLIAPNFLKVFGANQNRRLNVVMNPYENVDWDAVQRHKAVLHAHTLQSDGRHSVDDVVNAYRRAGFTIMAITDHDHREPNVHVQRGNLPPEVATPYPLDPKPANFPACPVWPWTDYGCSSPENLGMIGIKANELTNRHHVNSYYNDAGWFGEQFDRDRENWEDYEIDTVREKGGLALLCHPGWVRPSHRHPLDWYVERFGKHPKDTLIGIEICNCTVDTEPYEEGLWDQLLARFMPQRPIWGFGNDDIHMLYAVKNTFNLFLLSELNDANVRKAMERGQFLFARSSRILNHGEETYPGVTAFPQVQRIAVDNAKGTISIASRNCDQIKWISAPTSLEPTGDYKTSDSPFPLGNVVHTGSTLDLRNTPGLKNYVRAELHLNAGEHLYRTFTNPFGLA